MLHVGAGRSNVLRRLLVDAGVGCDERLSRLALYPAHSEEKRRVDGVLARKMGLGSLCYWAVRPGVSSVKGSGATCTGAQPVYTEDRQCEPGCIRSRSTQESSGAGDAGGWLACRKERTHVPPL
jgi:hypothetical protein